jgi:hypothetical protein
LLRARKIRATATKIIHNRLAPIIAPPIPIEPALLLIMPAKFDIMPAPVIAPTDIIMSMAISGSTKSTKTVTNTHLNTWLSFSM